MTAHALNGGMILLGKAGFLLFAAGLVIGLAIPAVRNSRMGLSAHLTAVQTGPALMVIALFWPYLGVPDAWAPLLTYVLIACAYVLVAGILLAAMVGASGALPIAGQGHNATATQERLVAILVKGSSIVMVITAAALSFFALT